MPDQQLIERRKIDGFVKSPTSLSFRAKREILLDQVIEKIRFLPAVEMTNADFWTFYEAIKIDAAEQNPNRQS
jgi:hypothetical protein